MAPDRVRAFPFDLLRKTMTPGTRIERYGREWRLGHFEDQGPSLMGRIGYQRLTGATIQVWSDTKSDFVDQAVMEGQTASYAIDRRTLRMAFQIRPPAISRASFTGAMTDLLAETTGLDGWALVPLVEGVSLQDWSESVGGVDEIIVKLERPNPHYAGRRRVEGLIEGIRAELVTVRAKAQDGEHIDLSDPFIVEMIEHADDYGSVKAVAHVGATRETWQSDAEGAPLETRVVLPRGVVEVPWPDARKALRAELRSEHDEE